MGTSAALIVAHGQPSDPAPAAAELRRLAAAVAGHLPGWHVGSATLAEPGALAEAIAAAGPEGLVYPLFMACGWFTRTHLPARLAAAGGAVWRVLRPFGCDEGVKALAVAQALEAVVEPRAARVLVAAHGSGRSAAPSAIAEDMAARLVAAGFAGAAAAFIDQSPQIAAATGYGAGDLCLPFFAAEGGHVTDDLPRALAQARFAGRLLPAVGLDPRVPGLIAAALRATQADPGAPCRGVICAQTV